MTPLLELKDIRRSYPAGDEQVEVLKGISLDIYAGEMVAIVGASGSGKSTLMNILGCLDKATSGTYRVVGQDVATLDADALAQLRREHFGFIFQRYHLLSHLTAEQNVEVPAVYAGLERKQRLLRAQELLQRLGLEDRTEYYPAQLSGGQQQRVSIARALMNGGQVILADEPTGALDSHSGEEVMAILHQLRDRGHTVIIVTHDPQVAAQAERTREIGIRMAVGARASDVLQQFLIEAVLVCLVGGALGITLSLLIAFTLQLFLPGWEIGFSPLALLLAFLCSTVTGILFGWLPARNAARLDPVDALARE
ncbi:ATP-binding cassette domain-containing protein [Escherichia coli]